MTETPKTFEEWLNSSSTDMMLARSTKELWEAIWNAGRAAGRLGGLEDGRLEGLEEAAKAIDEAHPKKSDLDSYYDDGFNYRVRPHVEKCMEIIRALAKGRERA